MLIQVFQQLGQRRVGKAVLERMMQSSASMATECMPAAKAAQSTGEDLNTDSPDSQHSGAPHLDQPLNHSEHQHSN